MGAEISLNVGGLTISWAKNNAGTNHGPLFEEGDRKILPPEDPDFLEQFDPARHICHPDAGFSRTLGSMVRRLELLGYTLESVEAEYDKRVKIWCEEQQSQQDGPAVTPSGYMSFDEYLAFMRRYPIASLDATVAGGFTESDMASIRGRIGDDLELPRVPCLENDNGYAYSERSFFGGFIAMFSDYSALRLLASCESNLDLPVAWRFGELVNAGWATEKDFEAGLRRRQKFLIATEGTSDANIVNRGMELLRPEVRDFFRFIDVSARHPFFGVGNLVKFAEGLVSIDVQNQIIFLFDNDAEGVEAYRKVAALKLPSNMGAALLPDIAAVRSFRVRGPSGDELANINGRAAAIECYLDLNLKQYPPASARWMNYKQSLDVYHGVLDHKESYSRGFLRHTAESLKAEDYDTSKLEFVLDALIAGCKTIAQKVFIDELRV